MSEDGTIGILVTKGKKTKCEFRVVNEQAFDMFLDEPDFPFDQPVFNREVTLRRFGKAQVFTEKSLAEQLALELFEERPWTEYGIKTFDYSSVEFPPPPQLAISIFDPTKVVYTRRKNVCPLRK